MEGTSMPTVSRPIAKRLAVVLAYSALPLLLVINAAIFPTLAGVGYLEWYLANGALISLALGFVALVWEGLEAREGLLSANPVAYLAACSALAGVLTFSVGTHLGSSRGQYAAAGGPVARAGVVWDQLVSALLALIVSMVAVGWVFIVAPAVYLTTLIAGAPARSTLRGESRRTLVRREAGRTVIEEVVAEATPERGTPADGVDVSFGRKPFATTQALSALVLVIAKYVLL
ncbi:MAG: hypothetical protein WD766_15145 [Gemmatimonadota bacterium]